MTHLLKIINSESNAGRREDISPGLTHLSVKTTTKANVVMIMVGTTNHRTGMLAKRPLDFLVPCNDALGLLGVDTSFALLEETCRC